MDSFQAGLTVLYSIVPQKEIVSSFIKEMSLRVHITLHTERQEVKFVAIQQVIGDVFKN